MSTPTTPDPIRLKQGLSHVISQSFNLATPLSMLETVRRKLDARDFADCDREDILEELGRLQHQTRQLELAMQQVYRLLKP